MNKYIITVTGSGRLHIQPDLALVNCSVSAQNTSYAGANLEMNRRTELLRKTLPGVGLKKSDLKTLDFAVRRHTERDPQTQQIKFAGYHAYHVLGLRLPLDKELNRVMEALLGSEADAQVDVSFTVANPEPTCERLLIAAVANARQRAEVIAKAAGVRLGKITNIIKHDFADMRLRASASFSNASATDIQAGSFALKDDVTVTWEILE